MIMVRHTLFGLMLLVVFTSPTKSAGVPANIPSSPSVLAPCSAVITAPLSVSDYYAIEMVPTKRVPGTGLATGKGSVRFARSPFGVAVSTRGSYVYDLSFSI